MNLTDPLDHARHDHPLAALGWDPGWAQAAADRLGRPARVVRVDRGGADVESTAGAQRVQLSSAVLAAALHDPVSTPCVGDWVLIDDVAAGAPTLTVVLPRRSAVVRAAVTPGASHGQVLAVNVDHVLVVEPAQPQPDLARVERLLALAWESGATPAVVLTKADLAADVDDWLVELAAAAPGVQVHGVSAVTGAGLGELAGRLAPRTTVVLLGPSGAGKSTLTNALAGVAHMATQELRADGRGRHTTVHRELVRLPSGVLLIDTPGLRAVGLLDTEAGLDRVFTDSSSGKPRGWPRARTCGCAKPGPRSGSGSPRPGAATSHADRSVHPCVATLEPDRQKAHGHHRQAHQQIDQPEGLGGEQLLQRRQVDAGQLQAQRREHGHQQQRVGPTARSGA